MPLSFPASCRISNLRWDNLWRLGLAGKLSGIGQGCLSYLTLNVGISSPNKNAPVTPKSLRTNLPAAAPSLAQILPYYA